MSATDRSLRFLKLSARRAPSATEATPILVEASGDRRCELVVKPEDGWWIADVVFNGQTRHIGKFGSETQAKRVAGRWRDALLGEDKKIRESYQREPSWRKRGEAGKPGAPLGDKIR